MGKRKQKGKSMTMADRERLRLQTDFVGLENQHVATVDMGNENVRRLHGRNVLIPPLVIPPEVPKNKIPPHPDSTESFDLGISLPTLPTVPEPLTSQTDQPVMVTVPNTTNTPVSPQTKQKPPVPLRPALLGKRDPNIQGVLRWSQTITITSLSISREQLQR